jgi:hypothetical protein
MNSFCDYLVMMDHSFVNESRIITRLFAGEFAPSIYLSIYISEMNANGVPEGFSSSRQMCSCGSFV